MKNKQKHNSFIIEPTLKEFFILELKPIFHEAERLDTFLTQSFALKVACFNCIFYITLSFIINEPGFKSQL